MSEGPADRLEPQPRWPTVANPFDSAAESFAAGNYAITLDMAPAGSALYAAALVMSGRVRPGLSLLNQYDSSEMRLVRAYAHWCLDEPDQARKLLKSLAGSDVAREAAELAVLLDETPEVVLVSMPNSSHAGRFQVLENFRVHSIQLDAERFGTTMADAVAHLPTKGPVRLIAVIDAYGPYLPRHPRDPGIPIAMWEADHDFFFATRHADLARADVIVVNAAAEHVEMAPYYAGRITVFAAHESYLPQREGPARIKRDTDILFTGRAFAPYMRDKAQVLFRLATLEDPELSIELVDGYLPEADYQAMLARARHVPLFRRYAGGLPLRGMEAMRAGARVLSPEADIARPLLGSAAPAWRSIVEADVAPMLAETVRLDGSAPDDLAQALWPPPEREARYLKFCLFQAILAGRRERAATAPAFTPVEQRGYPPTTGPQIYTRIARLNSETEAPIAANFIHAAAAAFYAAILVPRATQIAGMALDFYRAGVAAFPQSLALRFNAARALWTFGLRAEAVEAFRAIVEQLPDLAFDARTDALLSHRIRVLADMFPYGDFYRAAVAVPDPRSRTPGPREFVASAALGYLAADLLERGEPHAAVALLQRSVERCEVNVGAWRLLARALAKAGASAERVRDAFYTAVNLYPAELIELLPVGLEAELADGRTGQAARLLRQWVLLRTRVRDAQGRPMPASAEAVAAAERYRAVLSDWTAKLLDRMVAAK